MRESQVSRTFCLNGLALNKHIIANLFDTFKAIVYCRILRNLCAYILYISVLRYLPLSFILYKVLGLGLEEHGGDAPEIKDPNFVTLSEENVVFELIPSEASPFPTQTPNILNSLDPTEIIKGIKTEGILKRILNKC